MKFLLDTANIPYIRKYTEIYPISGITTNPSIIKKEGPVNFFEHLKQIRNIIGTEKSLHVQVLGNTSEIMVKEAHAVLENVDKKVFIKIPTNEEGIKAIKILKSEGIGVTATAIYTKIQGFLAIEAGTDYIAPYYNRMENLDIDPISVISAFSKVIEEGNYNTKILAASFKNITQVNNSFLAGAQTATVSPDMIHGALGNQSIQKAIDDFASDWLTNYPNKKTILDL